MVGVSAWPPEPPEDGMIMVWRDGHAHYEAPLPDGLVQLPRLGGSLCTRGYVIRCGCWQDRVVLWRRFHFWRLVRRTGLEARR